MLMTILLIIAWVLSPLVFIPLTISLSGKLKKHRQFIEQLRLRDRISAKELYGLEVDDNERPAKGGPFAQKAQSPQAPANIYSPSAGRAADMPPVRPEQNKDTPAAAAHQVPEKAQQPVKEETPAEKEAQKQPPARTEAKKENVPEDLSGKVPERPADVGEGKVPVPTGYMGNNPQTPYVPRTKARHHYDSATVLFGIGMVFVILAGIIFSTAFWVYLSDIARTGVIAGAAAFFFGISTVSRKKFKLISTSASLFLLGSVFTVITFITAGYLEIFGHYFSLHGGGVWLFLAFSSLSITACAAAAVKIYPKPLCSYVLTGSVFLSAALVIGHLSHSFSRPYAAFALLLTIFGAAVSAVKYFYEKSGREISTVMKHCLAAVRTAYALMSLPLLLKEFILPDGWTAFGWALCLICLAECLWIAIRSKDIRWLWAECFFLCFAVLDLYTIMEDRSLFVLLITAFGVLTTAVYTFLELKGRLLIDAEKVKYAVKGFLTLMTVAHFDAVFGTSWDLMTWTAALMVLLELGIYAVIKKSQAHLYIHGVLLAGLIGCLGLTIDDHSAFALGVGLFAAAGGALYNYLHLTEKDLFDAHGPYLLTRILLALMAVPVLFTDLPYWTVYTLLLCILMCAEFLALAIIKKDIYDLALHCAVLLMLILEGDQQYGDHKLYGLYIALFSAAAGGVYHYLKTRGTLRLKADTVNAVMKVLLFIGACLAAAETSPPGLGTGSRVRAMAFVFIAESLAYAIITKRKDVLTVHGVLLWGYTLEESLLAGSYTRAAFIVTVCVAVLTTVYYLMSTKRKLTFNADGPAGIMRILFLVSALPAAIDSVINEKADPWVFGISLILTAELIIYSIAAESKLLKRLTGFSLLLMASSGVLLLAKYVPQVDRPTEVFIITALSAAVMAAFLFIERLHSLVTDLVLCSALLYGSSWLLNKSALPYGLMCAGFTVLIFAVFAFLEKHPFRHIFRLALPVPVIYAAHYLSIDLARPGGEMMVFCITVALFAGVSFLLSTVPEELERKIRLTKYSLECFGILALFIAMDSYSSTAAPYCFGAAAALMLAGAIHTSRKNFHALAPMMMMPVFISGAAEAAYPLAQAGNIKIIASILLTALYALVSRLLFADGLVRRKEGGRVCLDVAAIGILFCAFSAACKSSLFSDRAVSFIIILELTVFTANLYRRSFKTFTNRIIITAAAALGAAALVVRPFMVVDNSIVTAKVVIAIIALFGLGVKYIWAEDKKISVEFSSAVYMTAYALLLLDALMNQTVANSLIVLSVSLLVLLMSFIMKSKRWFLLSAVSMTGLTLYITRDFLSSVAWWIYLLIAGILLMTIASINEYFKSRGENVKEIADKFFSDWTW